MKRLTLAEWAALGARARRRAGTLKRAGQAGTGRATEGWQSLITGLACTLLVACAAHSSGPVVHQGAVKGAVAAAWSPDGTRLAVANNRRIWTYDAKSLALQRELYIGRKVKSGFEFEERYGLGNSLVFLDERRLATTGMGNRVSIWDVETAERIESFDWPEDAGYPISLAWSEPAGLLAAGTGTGSIVLLQPGTGAVAEILSPAGGALHAIRFGAEGDYLGTAGTGGEVVIWNVPARTIATRIPARGVVMDIEPIGAAGHFLVAGEELEIWSFTQPDTPAVLANPELGAQGAGYALAALTLAATAVLAPLSPAETLLIGTPPPPSGAVAKCGRAAAVDPGGARVADMHPGYLRERIRIIEAATGEVVEDLNPRGGLTCDLEFSPDGTRLLIANQAGGHVYETAAWTVTRLEASYTRPR